MNLTVSSKKKKKKIHDNLRKLMVCGGISEGRRSFHA